MSLARTLHTVLGRAILPCLGSVQKWNYVVVIVLVITMVGQHLGEGDGEDRWKQLRPIETVTEKSDLKRNKMSPY